MKPNAALADAKSYAVRRMRATGEHQRILERYFGEYTVQDCDKAVPAGAQTV